MNSSYMKPTKFSFFHSHHVVNACSLKAWLNQETLLRKQCFLLCFLGWLKWKPYVSDAKFVSGKQKCFWLHGKNIFCFRAAKFVSATHVSRAAKLGNICIRNNVSATMFPSIARPLRENHLCQTSKSALCLFRITCLTWNNRKKT